MSMRTKTYLPPVYEKIRVHQAPSVLNEIKESGIAKFRRLVRNIIKERRFIHLITQHLDIKEREEDEIYKKQSMNFTPLSAKHLIERMNQEKEKKALRKPQEKKGTIETLVDNHINKERMKSRRMIEPPIIIENEAFFAMNNLKPTIRNKSRFKATVPVNPITSKFLNEKEVINKKMEEVEKRFEETLSKTPNMKKFIGKTSRIGINEHKVVEIISPQCKITRFKSILGEKRIITPCKLDLTNGNLNKFRSEGIKKKSSDQISADVGENHSEENNSNPTACSSSSGTSPYKKSKRISSSVVASVAVYTMPNSSGILTSHRKRSKHSKKLKRKLTPINHFKHNSKLIDVNEMAADRYLMTQLYHNIIFYLNFRSNFFQFYWILRLINFLLYLCKLEKKIKIKSLLKFCLVLTSDFMVNQFSI